MMMMGYDDTMGLGRYNQGIMDPIEVTMRPPNHGLGYREDEKGVEDPKVEEVMVKGEEQDEEELLKKFKEEAEAAAVDKACRELLPPISGLSQDDSDKEVVAFEEQQRRNPTKKNKSAPSFIVKPRILKTKKGIECDQKEHVPCEEQQVPLVPYGEDDSDNEEVAAFEEQFDVN
ncbi:hypothetical protein F2Q69_00025633 [Brassica cretica]|uniref:G-patch domain-containing protein n=1 Tax=Brassica cretica TaxID=69181 RepID=A0A8S9RXH0_BRACR|nr:hypothetical protein F2Q69_00025633 [Brassica cretica]